jgi:adenylate cyclase
MEDDEEATIRTINAYREVITGLIKDHRGRVVDAKGDNVLTQFPSVVVAGFYLTPPSPSDIRNITVMR